MPGNAKTCFAPRRDEQIGFVPTIKADAEGIPRQDAIHGGKGGFKPGSVVVVDDGASATILILGDVGRISDDQIRATGWELRHLINAVAVDDGVEWGSAVHDDFLSWWVNDAKEQGRAQTAALSPAGQQATRNFGAGRLLTARRGLPI